jgi:DNA helicase-2/ATP-dependent DNA helicase PcrA
MEIFKELNPQQAEAVKHTEGPVLIVAGAGAGKTKTITYRILNLIEQGVAPESILAITFTNKAAKEMRDRVEKLLLEKNRDDFFSGKPFVSTFHSLGVYILKENTEHLGLPRHFGIYDKNDSKRAVKEALTSCNYDPKQYDPGKIESAISRQKGNFVTAEEFVELAGNDYFQRIVSEVWNKYESILKREKSLDFDDLLLKTAKLLMNKPEVLDKYQQIWRYIHIDEYQDTNKVQYAISKLIADKYKNICVVGDTDQNIYSWRGADIKNILNFEKHYPGAKIVFLEENYRSTKNILAAADQIIQKNKFRIPKKIFTSNPEGEKISLFEAYDEANEAGLVAQKCKELIANGVSPKEIAILYRANFQSRALEEAFLAHEVPYQMLGTRFYERKEIKDILSFIKAALNPDSVSDISRIINIPARGIGKVTLQKIFAGKVEELPAGMRKKYSDFKALLAKIADFAIKTKPSETIKFIIQETGLEMSLKDGTDEDNERLENIMELVTLATKYDIFTPEEGIEKLLTDAALASDQDSLIKEQEAVKLMTVHASKGLEFDYVFVTGMEADLFPHKKHNEYTINSEEAEEERRLFYVAITRARKKLFLCYAQTRMIFGSKQINMPSEFLCDIDDNYIEKDYMDSDDTPKKPLFRIEF